ncbi:Ig-like domain-containing protein [Marinimicrobium sp. ABcell2]|uniref:Ig-like domain-containing protein n=1 Tax=Marinimicrobium sp. ABcell2 TaxID=3069751 RepID=UPI0027AF6286|nr:hypothetical protein [Marinimicrobium sp. ABcell2]MDQ2076888.1 hypothetical protein [Marinimicrobium sp. ABcell2]
MFKEWLIVLAAAVVLTACGGGGESDPPATGGNHGGIITSPPDNEDELDPSDVDEVDDNETETESAQLTVAVSGLAEGTTLSIRERFSGATLEIQADGEYVALTTEQAFSFEVSGHPDNQICAFDSPEGRLIHETLLTVECASGIELVNAKIDYGTHEAVWLDVRTPTSGLTLQLDDGQQTYALDAEQLGPYLYFVVPGETVPGSYRLVASTAEREFELDIDITQTTLPSGMMPKDYLVDRVDATIIEADSLLASLAGVDPELEAFVAQAKQLLLDHRGEIADLDPEEAEQIALILHANIVEYPEDDYVAAQKISGCMPHAKQFVSGVIVAVYSVAISPTGPLGVSIAAVGIATGVLLVDNGLKGIRDHCFGPFDDALAKLAELSTFRSSNKFDSMRKSVASELVFTHSESAGFQVSVVQPYQLSELVTDHAIGMAHTLADYYESAADLFRNIGLELPKPDFLAELGNLEREVEEELEVKELTVAVISPQHIEVSAENVGAALELEFAFASGQASDDPVAFSFEVADSAGDWAQTFDAVLKPLGPPSAFQSASSMVLKNGGWRDVLDAHNAELFEIVDHPDYGEVVLDDEKLGIYTYRPDFDYTGDDRFTFVVTNEWGDSSVKEVQLNIGEDCNDVSVETNHRVCWEWVPGIEARHLIQLVVRTLGSRDQSSPEALNTISEFWAGPQRLGRRSESISSAPNETNEYTDYRRINVWQVSYNSMADEIVIEYAAGHYQIPNGTQLLWGNRQRTVMDRDPDRDVFVVKSRTTATVATRSIRAGTRSDMHRVDGSDIYGGPLYSTVTTQCGEWQSSDGGWVRYSTRLGGYQPNLIEDDFTDTEEELSNIESCPIATDFSLLDDIGPEIPPSELQLLDWDQIVNGSGD